MQYQNKNPYRVQFKMNKDVTCSVCVGSLDDIANGFWVNRDCEFTKGSDAKFFIFPHMITHLEKV